MAVNPITYYLPRYFTEYIPTQRAYSPNTVASYRDTFVLLLSFFRDELHIRPEKLTYENFSAENIEHFLSWMEETRGISASTRNQRLAAIHSFFRYIQYKDPACFEQCGAVLSIPYKKAQTVPMNYLSIEEIRTLLLLPDQKCAAGLRDMAILVLLYETAARVQELIDLTPASFQYKSTTVIELRGKGNKTRLVPLNAEATGIVRNYMHRFERQNVNEPLFVNRKGEKLTRAGIQYIIDKYIEMARTQHPDMFKFRITNHCFRHSKAMHLLEAGVNLIYIRDFLGHASVITTEVYAKTNPKIKEEQLIKHSPTLESRKRYCKDQKDDLIQWMKKNL